MADFWNFDALPVAIVGNSGATVNLQDLLTSAFGEQVNSIGSVRLAYRDATFLASATDANGNSAPFLYWTPANQTVTTISNNGVAIAANVFNNTQPVIDSAHFRDITFTAGSNIMPNVYLTVEWLNNGIDRQFEEFTVATVPSRVASNAVFDGSMTAADVVTAARAFVTAYGGAANTNDCHWMASDIAAAAGAPLDAMTWSTNPALNEDGGYWRAVHRGSDSAVDNWQTLVQPGDTVRMGWTGGGFHTVTVTEGLNAAGQIRVVDNTGPRDASGRTTISEHWVDFDGAATNENQITIYRISLDQRNLINGSARADTIVGTVFSDHIKGGLGADTISGGKGNDFLLGNDGADTLRGGEGNDALDGGAGDDKMYGGKGNDGYTVDSRGDIVSEDDVTAGGGVDEVYTSVEIGHTLWSGIENLRLLGAVVTGDGNEDANIITGNDTANTLRGHGGQDAFIGYGGADKIDGGAGIDTANYNSVRSNYQVVRLSTGHIKITDLRAGSPDGADDVTGVEKFQFGDGVKTVAQLIDAPDFAVFWNNAATNDTREWTFTNGALSSSLALGAPASSWNITATGDFNGDGLSDAIWQDSATGSVRDWLLSSSGVRSTVDLGGMAAAWRVLGTGDFNGDGTSDLLWQNTSSGELREWVMSNGAIGSTTALGTAAPNWRLVGTGDFTGDGASDMLWRNTSTGEVREWKMSNGAISQVSVLGSFNSEWNTAATGDFNGDGTTDIIWRNVSTGDTRDWLMSNGNLSSSVLLPGPPPNWKLIGAGDFNQNGTDDLLWQNTSTGELREWLLSNGQLASNISLDGAPPSVWHPAVNPATDSDFLPVI